MTSTSQPDPPPLAAQIQQVLTSLMAGPESKSIKPGHYIVIVDTNVTEWSTIEILQDLQKQLALVDIHLHLVPTVPGALTFIEVAPALAQFAPEGAEARG